MIIKTFFTSLLSFALLTFVLSPTSAIAQDNNSNSSQNENETTMEGTVVSSNRSTLVVRTEDDKFQLFTFDQDTTRPRAIGVGSRVRVVSTSGDVTGARLASSVVVLSAAQAAAASGGQSARGSRSTEMQAAPVPPAVRNVERNIQRETRRWRLGVRAGVTLDPELVMFGAHSQMGPIFSRNVFFRPNAEFAWGEVTDMIALNLEGAYKTPITSRRGDWSSYIGAGPSLNFIHQSFQTRAGEQRDISFSNFDYQTGFNIFTGVQFRSGTFFEVKTSLWAHPSPTLRLILGYNF
jgi:hypothetical protein